METKRISTTQQENKHSVCRPRFLGEFIGQEDTKKVIKAAITSAHTSGDALGHILFSGESGYGKTTLAQIVAEEMNSKITIITGYALSKPADMVSLLNSL